MALIEGAGSKPLPKKPVASPPPPPPPAAPSPASTSTSSRTETAQDEQRSRALSTKTEKTASSTSATSSGASNNNNRANNTAATANPSSGRADSFEESSPTSFIDNLDKMREQARVGNERASARRDEEKAEAQETRERRLAFNDARDNTQPPTGNSDSASDFSTRLDQLNARDDDSTEINEREAGYERFSTLVNAGLDDDSGDRRVDGRPSREALNSTLLAELQRADSEAEREGILRAAFAASGETDAEAFTQQYSSYVSTEYETARNAAQDRLVLAEERARSDFDIAEYVNKNFDADASALEQQAFFEAAAEHTGLSTQELSDYLTRQQQAQLFSEARNSYGQQVVAAQESYNQNTTAVTRGFDGLRNTLGIGNSVYEQTDNAREGFAELDGQYAELQGLLGQHTLTAAESARVEELRTNLFGDGTQENGGLYQNYTQQTVGIFEEGTEVTNHAVYRGAEMGLDFAVQGGLFAIGGPAGWAAGTTFQVGRDNYRQGFENERIADAWRAGDIGELASATLDGEIDSPEELARSIGAGAIRSAPIPGLGQANTLRQVAGGMLADTVVGLGQEYVAQVVQTGDIAATNEYFRNNWQGEAGADLLFQAGAAIIGGGAHRLSNRAGSGGHAPDTDLRVVDGGQPIPAPAMDNRPDLREIDAELAAVEASSQAAQGPLLPDGHLVETSNAAEAEIARSNAAISAIAPELEIEAGKQAISYIASQLAEDVQPPAGRGTGADPGPVTVEEAFGIPASRDASTADVGDPATMAETFPGVDAPRQPVMAEAVANTAVAGNAYQNVAPESLGFTRAADGAVRPDTARVVAGDKRAYTVTESGELTRNPVYEDALIIANGAQQNADGSLPPGALLVDGNGSQYLVGPDGTITRGAFEGGAATLGIRSLFGGGNGPSQNSTNGISANHRADSNAPPPQRLGIKDTIEVGDAHIRLVPEGSGSQYHYEHVDGSTAGEVRIGAVTYNPDEPFSLPDRDTVTVDVTHADGGRTTATYVVYGNRLTRSSYSPPPANSAASVASAQPAVITPPLPAHGVVIEPAANSTLKITDPNNQISVNGRGGENKALRYGDIVRLRDGSTFTFDNGTFVEIPLEKAKLITELFPNGVYFSDFQQGSIGDCTLLASIKSVLNADPAQLVRMIEPSTNKGYVRVNFPGGNQYELSIHFDDLHRRVKGEKGFQVLERAFSRELGAMPCQTIQFLNEGGYVEQALQSLTGNKPTILYNPNGLANKTDPSSPEWADVQANLQLVAGNPGKYIAVGSSTGTGNWQKGVLGNHAYSILDVDAANQAVRLSNPHDSARTFTLSVDEFGQAFRRLSFAERPIRAQSGLTLDAFMGRLPQSVPQPRRLSFPNLGNLVPSMPSLNRRQLAFGTLLGATGLLLQPRTLGASEAAFDDDEPAVDEMATVALPPQADPATRTEIIRRINQTVVVERPYGWTPEGEGAGPAVSANAPQVTASGGTSSFDEMEQLRAEQAMMRQEQYEVQADPAMAAFFNAIFGANAPAAGTQSVQFGNAPAISLEALAAIGSNPTSFDIQPRQYIWHAAYNLVTQNGLPMEYVNLLVEQMTYDQSMKYYAGRDPAAYNVYTDQQPDHVIDTNASFARMLMRLNGQDISWTYGEGEAAFLAQLYQT